MDTTVRQWGHALFTPVTLIGRGPSPPGMALGPIAVLPEMQRKGVGSALINDGLSQLVDGQMAFVVVLGHPEYYPRFDFVPASRHGVSCKWKVPDPVFMIRVLDAALMRGAAGRVEYAAEFDSV